MDVWMIIVLFITAYLSLMSGVILSILKKDDKELINNLKLDIMRSRITLFFIALILCRIFLGSENKGYFTSLDFASMVLCMIALCVACGYSSSNVDRLRRLSKKL